MRKQAGIGALLLICVGVVLGATVFRSDIAQATGLAQLVTVNNTAAQAVPVREQNLDGGNIKVHEEGTTKVKVTNASLSVQPAAPITGGGWIAIYPAGQTFSHGTASAVSIHMTSGVRNVQFLNSEGLQVAGFVGPYFGHGPDIDLAFNRPIQFDEIVCTGDATDQCFVGWVGAQP